MIKYIQYVIIPIAVALFIIGVHQTMVLGIAHAYPFFMFSTFLWLYFQYLKTKKQDHKKS